MDICLDGGRIGVDTDVHRLIPNIRHWHRPHRYSSTPYRTT